MSVDPQRLRRALRLKVDRLPHGWQVTGRLVDEHDGCMCPDRTIRGEACKHELAARLDALDPELLGALRELAEPTEGAGQPSDSLAEALDRLQEAEAAIGAATPGLPELERWTAIEVKASVQEAARRLRKVAIFAKAGEP